MDNTNIDKVKELILKLRGKEKDHSLVEELNLAIDFIPMMNATVLSYISKVITRVVDGEEVKENQKGVIAMYIHKANYATLFDDVLTKTNLPDEIKIQIIYSVKDLNH